VSASGHHLIGGPPVCLFKVGDHFSHMALEARVPPVELLSEMRVALQQLAGCESQRNSRLDSIHIQHLHNGLDGSLHLAIEVQGWGDFSGVRLLEGRSKQRLLTLPTPGDGWDHRDTELAAQLLGVDLDSSAIGLIHHIQGDDHGFAQFEQLKGQLQ